MRRAYSHLRTSAVYGVKSADDKALSLKRFVFVLDNHYTAGYGYVLRHVSSRKLRQTSGSPNSHACRTFASIRGALLAYAFCRTHVMCTNVREVFVNVANTQSLCVVNVPIPDVLR